MKKSDWLLTASLDDGVAGRLGMEEISKLYEDTTVVEAFTNFLVALEDNGITEDDCGLIAVEPAVKVTVADGAAPCKVCGGRALDFRCPECDPIKIWKDDEGILFGCRDDKTRARWERNAYRSDLPNGACVICGKGLGTLRNAAIHIVAGGGAVLAVDDEGRYQDDGGDMGSWGIGSECRKLIPAEYVHEFSNV